MYTPVRLVFRIWSGEYDPAEFSGVSRVIAEDGNDVLVEEIGTLNTESGSVRFLDGNQLKNVLDWLQFDSHGLQRVEVLSALEWSEYSGD